MFGFFLGLLTRRVSITILGAGLLLQGYWLFGPEDEGLGFAVRSLADRTAAQAAADLPDRKGAVTLAVLPLLNDQSQVVSRRLRSAIAVQGRYQIIEESLLGRLLDEIGRSAQRIATLDEAVAAARRIGADIVIFGQVTRLVRDGTNASVAVDLRMAERDTGQAVFVKHYEDRIEGRASSLSYWRARLADSPKPRRALIWICWTLLLPLVTAGLIRRVTAEESNVLNAALLLGYSVIDGLVACGLTGFWLVSWWTVTAVGLATVLAGIYNLRIATAIDELRT